MSIIKSGKLWPIGVALAIVGVAGFCVWTVKVTSSANIQESDAYMTNYQDADAKANDFIKARIKFDKKYNIAYVTESIGGENPIIKYKISDKSGNPVNNATITVAISRPETKKYDQKLSNVTVDNGIYSIKGATFPMAGVYNIVAKVSIGDDYRFYNMKADTRIKEAFEY